MPNSVTVNRPITRNRVCTKPGTVQSGTIGPCGKWHRRVDAGALDDIPGGAGEESQCEDAQQPEMFPHSLPFSHTQIIGS